MDGGTVPDRALEVTRDLYTKLWSDMEAMFTIFRMESAILGEVVSSTFS